MDEARTKHSRRARVGPLLGAGMLTMLLTACGSSGTPQQSATSSIGSSTPSSVPAGITTVQGTVTKGVENGCVVLVDASGAVVANLQGWDLQAHPFGSPVEVTGTFEPDLMTTCQQGTPFEASSVVSR